MNASPARRKSSASSKASAALRLARSAWRLQYRDSTRSLALAERALALATAADDVAAESWARLVRGFHRMRYATPAEAVEELEQAKRCGDAAADRAAQILAVVGIARCEWMQAKYRESLDRLLPLRDEGLRVLRHEARGMLLNGIAGCYSALGDSAQAFAYMYQALRESQPARNYGFEVVLYCNLAHELFQLGEYDEALSYLGEGIDRCSGLANARLLSVLHVNRVVCLTDLGHPGEALADIDRLLALPADESGRGVEGAAFETMAIAALRAGQLALGTDLVSRARARVAEKTVPDEAIEGAVAEAELLRAQGDLAAAAEHLEASLPLPAEGVSLRVRCLFFQTLADMQESVGNASQALRHLRTWQQLHIERAQRASRARQQAASLQTELLRLRRERDLIEARRLSTERAKAGLEAINQQLSQKVDEVEALQAALQRQAVRDFLTGLFNRRHLNDVLPSMLALARRDGQPLAVAIIDLDHFKDVNDQHGHLAGDMLLAAFAKMLAQRLRKSDVACRYGGEEFCVLMPRTAAPAAQRKIAALLKLWRNAVFIHDAVSLAGNTFSAGVADSGQVRESGHALLRTADDCVLEAKRLGRNRVVAYERIAQEVD
jgi:diguanylate cyclase (GGDEF)-like protein